MADSYPTIIPGLRSPSESIQGIVHFGRMLDKMRLSAAGKLPPGWEESRGTDSPTSFDAFCCTFLHVNYAALEAETLKGKLSDEQLLDWAFQQGRKPTEQEILIWSTFMTKRGWRDEVSFRVVKRLADIGLPAGTVETMFEFIDLDEGRREVGR
ncbi:MAG TPA: DUF5069 domain-containing protein [Verrucomicrobiae bacterium]|nr:DUF5069 domain-containing protein [Verrucomicrobiae bacterium]